MNELREKILRIALQNAVEHGGKAAVNAVLSKILGEEPSLRPKAREIKEMVAAVVEEINKIELKEQQRMLGEKLGQPPETKPPTVEERHLPPLPHAEKGKVVTRLPPEPSGYMHAGHAIAGLINEYYARFYDGKLWLRFEDTNPRKAHPIYYESFRRGYRWLGIEWDYEKNNSDDMELYYELVEKMVRDRRLYPCFCSVEEMRRQRAEGIRCQHSELDPDFAEKVWAKAMNGAYREGEVVFRLKGISDSPNTALRDPVMFRIVDHPHPLKGSRYRLWPTYDFAAAVQDAICGVTHVLRSSEFAFRDELQNMIRNFLGLPNPVYVEFARFEFKGVTTSKREIRSLIEEGHVSGWDDPRLTTIEALKRRGLRPQTFREFMMTYAGVSYAKKEYDWSLLYSINRKILDPVAKRLFFVPDPVKIELRNFGGSQVEIPFHPSADLGKRTLTVRDRVYISRQDAERLRPGAQFRCKLFANIKIVERTAEGFVGEVVPGPPPKDGMIVQWVGDDFVECKVLRYGELLNEDGSINRESLWTEEGFCEKSVEQVSYDEVVQFERYGFVRRDSSDSIIFVYCHE
ncbi:MAG: glutamate--tRNA ligase [Candidatus Caldarchaeum sp.]|nr:glutamate--tRNA ligase [Candidatus Caldarchaeum sp.]